MRVPIEEHRSDCSDRFRANHKIDQSFNQIKIALKFGAIETTYLGWVRNPVNIWRVKTLPNCNVQMNPNFHEVLNTATCEIALKVRCDSEQTQRRVCDEIRVNNGWGLRFKKKTKILVARPAPNFAKNFDQTFRVCSDSLKGTQRAVRFDLLRETKGPKMHVKIQVWSTWAKFCSKFQWCLASLLR